jgi:hypothetical protein
VNSTLAFFDNDVVAAPTPTFPDGWTKTEVRTASQASALATITSPGFAFSVKKGEAYNRNFKFRT